MPERCDFPDLMPLLSPRSIAVVGASADYTTNSGRVLINLQKCRYQGRIFPVNPNYREISGLRCYPSLLEVPEAVETVLLVVSVHQVFQCLEDCEKKGVRFVVIFSSGFAEEGNEGRQKQQLLREFSRRTGIRIYGPNTPGLINLKEKVGYSFSPQFHPDRFVPGRIALVTQGGGVGRAILDAQERGIGFNYWVSTGNEADLEITDFINYFIEDPDTDMVLAVMESLGQGRRFAHVADRAARKNKPIVVLKLGRTLEGSRAAFAHTGTWSGCDGVYRALFRQKGVIQVDDLDQLLGVGTLFKQYKMPVGNGVGVFSFSGSTGVLLADMCGLYGLSLPAPSPDTTVKLAGLQPQLKSISNPLDLTTLVYDYPELFIQALEIFVQDSNFDIILLPFPFKLGAIGELMAASVINISRRCAKPMVPVWMSRGIIRERGYELLAESGLPLFYSAAQCLSTLRAYLSYTHVTHRVTPSHLPDYPEVTPGLSHLPYLEMPRGKLTHTQAVELLKYYGIPVAEIRTAHSLSELEQVARALGYPVIVKPNHTLATGSDKILPVRILVRSEEEIQTSYGELCQAGERLGITGQHPSLLVQRADQERAGMVIRVFQDPQFGTVVGMGPYQNGNGNGLSLRVAPLTTVDVEHWLREMGEHGNATAMGTWSQGSLVDLVVRVSRLGVDWEPRGIKMHLVIRETLPTGSFEVYDVVASLEHGTEPQVTIAG